MRTNTVKLQLILVVALNTAIFAQAGLGNLGKIAGAAGIGKGGGDIQKIQSDLFGKFSPASVSLAEAAQLYAEALDLKIRDNSEAAKRKSEEAVAIAHMEYVKAVASEVGKAANDPDKINMSPEQKEKLKQAHTKLLEGGGKFVAVATPTALAINDITSKDPKALLGHPELVSLAAICTKDAGTLLSLLNNSSKLAKAKAIEVPADTEFKPQ